MLSAPSHQSTLCPGCRQRTVRDGVVCRECYSQLTVPAIAPEVLAIHDNPVMVPLRALLLVIAGIAVALAAGRESVVLGIAVGIVLVLTVLLGLEQIRQRKLRGSPVTMREEGLCFLATGVTISVALLGLFGAFFGIAMAVMYVVNR
jgi:hypothetical protein